MKNIIAFICLVGLFSGINSAAAQKNILKYNSPIYDRDEALISPTDTIPDFKSKENQLKLTGIIYQSDGVTPAKDIILYIEQPNEHGDFELRKSGEERYVFHRSWVKTDAEGRYTFYTFVPGGDRRYNQLQQIFPLIKEPSKQEYVLDSFLFENDPLLTKTCRKRMAKKGDTTRILSPKMVDGMLVAERNIILKADQDLANL